MTGVQTCALPIYAYGDANSADDDANDDGDYGANGDDDDFNADSLECFSKL